MEKLLRFLINWTPDFKRYRSEDASWLQSCWTYQQFCHCRLAGTVGTEMKRLKTLCYQFIFNGFPWLFFHKIRTLEQWECAFSCLLLILWGKLWNCSSVSWQVHLGSTAQNSVLNTGDKNSACRNHHNKHIQVKAAVSCSEYTCAPFGFAVVAFPSSSSPDLQVLYLGVQKGRGLFLIWITAHVFETGPAYSWFVCLYQYLKRMVQMKLIVTSYR